MKMRNKEEGRRRVTPTFFFLRGFQTTEQERGGLPTFALWGRYFQERTSKAFGIRYLLVIEIGRAHV